MATAKHWTEDDVAELGALMIQADKLENAIEGVYLTHTTDEVSEALYEAQYHAHKAYYLLSRLAIDAEREVRQGQPAAGVVTPCSTCGGSGVDERAFDVCPRCGGTGEQPAAAVGTPSAGEQREGE